MKEIDLSQMMVAQVDDEDFDALSAYSWSAAESYPGFVYATARMGKRSRVYMHRHILQAPKGILVDHKDNDGLNNQRSNLRLCTHAQNSANSKVHKRNKLGLKGVCWHRTAYRSSVSVNGKLIYIGRFKTAVEAARAHDKIAEIAFGQFAWLNKDHVDLENYVEPR